MAAMKALTSNSNMPARPWWRQIMAAQEFGLVLVILALVAGLTMYTHLKFGPVPAPKEITPQPVGTVLTTSPDGESFTLTPPAGGSGEVRTYRVENGYSVSDTGERLVLMRERTRNKFFNKDNLLALLTATSFIAVMAVGMTGIIVMGGIDLSVGSIYALAAVVGAMVLNKLNGGGTEGAAVSAWVSVPVGVLVCCGIGAVCGLVNGSAIVGLGVHPFIITLGGLAVYRGIAFVATEGLSIGDFPLSFVKGFFKAEYSGVTPVPMFVMIVCGLVGMFVLTRTVFGRRVFAIGGNEIAARYAGVPVGRVKIVMFTLCGALAGLSGAMLLGYYGAGSSDAGKGYELSVIAAAVVGGSSLSGGRGSAIGAVLGAIVIQLIDNSILMLDINQNYKEIVIGLAIVAAVVVDQAKQRMSARR